ncbi:MAG: hypothetical protein ACLP7O_10400 [Terracidiphilus sp.]
MNCKYCGKWSGLFSDTHVDCSAAIEAGKTPEQIRQSVKTLTPDSLRPLTAVGVFWAVFLALCAFGLLSALVGLIAKQL